MVSGFRSTGSFGMARKSGGAGFLKRMKGFSTSQPARAMGKFLSSPTFINMAGAGASALFPEFAPLIAPAVAATNMALGNRRKRKEQADEDAQGEQTPEHVAASQMRQKKMRREHAKEIADSDFASKGFEASKGLYNKYAKSRVDRVVNRAERAVGSRVSGAIKSAYGAGKDDMKSSAGDFRSRAKDAFINRHGRGDDDE